MLVRKQRGILHRFNVSYLKTLDLAFESAIDVSKWDEALEFGQELLPGFRFVCQTPMPHKNVIESNFHFLFSIHNRKYNGDFNPLVGLLHMKMGKIQLFKGQPKQALHNLNRASDILKVTHGEEHYLYRKELVPLLIQAADECAEANDSD